MTQQTNRQPPRILVLGAHPDDAEFHVGGSMVLWRQLGSTVKVISVTDGSAGHHRLTRTRLRRVRARELSAAARLLGAEHEVWDLPDGELVASLENRHRVIAAIRRFRPDLVITHRPGDYHPDHRALGQLVQDASFMVRVPAVVPEVPALGRDPVVAYMADFFTSPRPFRADVVVDIESVLDTVISLLACHASQVFEWLPHLSGKEAEIPAGQAARRAWLRDDYLPRPGRTAQLSEAAHAGARPRYAEAFEISEYARALTDQRRAFLFPFAVGSLALPQRSS